MIKKIALLAGVTLGIGVVFYLADRLSSTVLWIIGFVAVGTFIRYGSIILIGGTSERIFTFFKRQPGIRIELINAILARRQANLNELITKEIVALLTILMARESIDVAHARAAEFPTKVFSDEFFQYMLQVLHDTRAAGLSREFQLQLAGFGENLAKKYQLSEWADEFHKQREIIFRRHAEGIPVIRAPR
ncbi:MAG: hypothetical protein QM730_20735 [Anaerolineales bacterium]